MDQRTPRRQLPWSTQILTGLSVGLVLGASARVFMRLLADEPEFSWGGTIFVVGVFTIFGATQSLVALVRSRTDSRWLTAPARLLGGASYLLLGGGAGIVMLPFLWCVSLAMWRTDWRRWLRQSVALVGAVDLIAVIVLQLNDVPFRPVHLLGFLLLLAVYLAAAWTAGSSLRPTR